VSLRLPVRPRRPCPGRTGRPGRHAGRHAGRRPVVLFRVAVRFAPALLLGALAAVLVSCGSSGAGLIPAGSAGPLRSDFQAVEAAALAGNGRCAATEAALSTTESDFRNLPAGVDAGLRNRLSEGIAKLHTLALELCTQPAGGTTTTGPAVETTPPASTTTETSTTSTTPPGTSTEGTSEGGTSPGAGEGSGTEGGTAPGASGGESKPGEGAAGAGGEAPKDGGAGRGAAGGGATGGAGPGEAGAGGGGK
jgi:hypothetical protein